MIRKLLVLGFLISCNSTVQKSETQEGYDPARIQRIADLQQELIDDGIMGGSHVVIYKGDRMIYDKIVNSGHEGDLDITDETIFPIWSMSKPITTVAAMILFEDCKFMLDDPVGKYLPELDSLQCLDEDGNKYPCENKVTIRHLLAHKSGIDYSSWSPWSEVQDSIEYYDKEFRDLEDFTTHIAKYPLLFEPGTNNQYGLNTAILGRLIEVVSGQGFYDFLKERIFDPLDMPDTDFDLTIDERRRFQPLFQFMDTTFRITTEFDELSYEPGSKVQLGGEGLVSTTSDYCHFCEMLLKDGVYNEKRILSPTSIAWMHYPQTDILWDGVKSGFTFFHLADPLTDGALSPEGIFGWFGAHNTYFWIDQQNDLYGLIMTRRTGSGAYTIFKKFRIATYQALI